MPIAHADLLEQPEPGPVESAGFATDVYREPVRRLNPYGHLAVTRDLDVWLEEGDIPCWTYRFWDRDDHPLYVGIADELNQRGSGHRAGSVWWPFAVRAEFTLFAGREDALNAEWYLIRTDQPIFNVTHAMTGPDRMVEYLAQREAWRGVDRLIEHFGLEGPDDDTPPASVRAWRIPYLLERFFTPTIGRLG